MSVFENLNKINVNEHIEKKNGLTYLSWAWAWSGVKQQYPEATFTVYENEKGWNYFTDGKTCWVKTGVTIEGIEHIEYLPVMDYRNQSIPADKVTSVAINKAIQRSLTKACARHGLGLYIYAGEDLPQEETSGTQPQENTVRPIKYFCPNCGKEVKSAKDKKGKEISAEQVYEKCGHKCLDCYMKLKNG